MVKLAVVPACVAMAGLTAPAAAFAPQSSFTPAVRATHRHAASRGMTMAANADHDILLRVARGEQAHRPPVWLMRQAGRYMKDFRAYSDKYAFRHRSETPEIAIELSLQPWRAFGVDGVIMFSDILTPFPAMGVEFDIVKGKGPAFASPVRTAADIAAMKILGEQVDIDAALPFVGQTLRALRKETEGGATLLGFVGAPWTLGAYAMEGSAPAEAGRAPHMRAMMDADPRLFGEYMTKLAVSVGEYACYQAEQGAQVIQFFESWAHRMTVADFEKWGRPYAEMSMNMVRERHPGVPVIYFANGGSAYLESMRGMKCNMIGLDQHVLIDDARRRLGADVPVSGNVDPDVLLESEDAIRAAVQDCVARAGPRGHILNLGHGVMQQTPEAAVAAFVDAAKQTRYAASALSV